MTVKCLGSGKIKVTLSLEERCRLFGESESLSPDSPAIKTALQSILKRIRYECSFLDECSSVCVDLYKDTFGGFIIYLTKIKPQTPKRTFLFTSTDNLLDAISSIKKRSLDYKVFAEQDRFYLELGKLMPSSLIPHIKEFCDKSAI